MIEERVSRGLWTWIVVSAALGVPALALAATGSEIDPILAAVVFGIGIVGGAFLLSWAAEVAQLDVSASLAISILALVAILPEYSIEAVLAWEAGASFNPATGEVTEEMQRVAANVTGANRLLIGLGWSMVILIYYLKRRRVLDLRGHLHLELRVLGVATVLSFLVFFMAQVHIVLAGVLIAIYLSHLWASSTQESEEPDLVGVSRLIGSFPKRQRRLAVALLLLYAATVIILAAEPFVDALVETGRELGIDDFILIQWIAPLASESPEIIVAVLFSVRANPISGLLTLISAEVSQLTLLVGSMVVVFSLSAGQPLSFALDPRQSTEFLLTSAVSTFALLLIASRLIGWKAGVLLLALFVVHLFFVDRGERQVFAYVYLALAAALVVLDPRRALNVFRGTSRAD